MVKTDFCFEKSGNKSNGQDENRGTNYGGRTGKRLQNYYNRKNGVPGR